MAHPHGYETMPLSGLAFHGATFERGNAFHGFFVSRVPALIFWCQIFVLLFVTNCRRTHCSNRKNDWPSSGIIQHGETIQFTVRHPFIETLMGHSTNCKII